MDPRRSRSRDQGAGGLTRCAGLDDGARGSQLPRHPVATGLGGIGALSATLAVGVAAAFVLGDKAASTTSSPKPWVAVIDIIAALLLVFFSVRFLRRPRDPNRAQSMVDQMSKIASSPSNSDRRSGRNTRQPGRLHPARDEGHLRDQSPAQPGTSSTARSVSVVSLLPLAVALIMLAVSPDRATRLLQRVRDWLLRNARLIAAAIMVLLAAAFLRDGISGLTQCPDRVPGARILLRGVRGKPSCFHPHTSCGNPDSTSHPAHPSLVRSPVPAWLGPFSSLPGDVPVADRPILFCGIGARCSLRGSP